MSKMISITVAIDNDEAFSHEVSLKIPEELNAEQVLDLFQQQHPVAIDLESQKIGVFGKPITLETIFNEGDRLEVYQALKIDPKQARRIRAERAAQNRKNANS